MLFNYYDACAHIVQLDIYFKLQKTEKQMSERRKEGKRAKAKRAPQHLSG